MMCKSEMQHIEALLENGGQSKFEWQSWRCVPTCPLSFETVLGSVSFFLAVSLISSRQAVWRGLKAFMEPSPGLINTHFLLEILAQTHRILWMIRWWHPVPPWLKHLHSIQCFLVRGMHIMDTACHQFILESKDYCNILQPYTLCFLFHFHCLCIRSCSSMHSHIILHIYVPYRGQWGSADLVKTMETVRQCFCRMRQM